MSASNDFETSLLQLLFENTNIANLGDATGVRGSTTAGSLYISLHTADPGEAGKQNTNETTYTGYARVAVARSTAGWTVTGNSVANDAAITFGTSTSGTPTITHFAVGYEASGATNILVSGALNNAQVINIGGTNSFAISALTVTVD